MFRKAIQIFKISDLRDKILAILFLLVVFRIFAAIPVPGVDYTRLAAFFQSSQLFGFLNIFSGGALANLSIAMLGVGPYITATIIMQLLTMIFPKLKAIYYEEGAAGRAKFNRYSRLLTVPLAALQGYGFLRLLASQNVLPSLTPFETLRNVVIITAGSVFLLWLGELISEKKIGNGVSLIIFAGIVSDLPTTLYQFVVAYDPAALPTYFAFAAIAIVVIAAVVFINEGERKIPISYAKRIRGMKMYGGAVSYLPLKVNQAGVIPIIFAISILLFPQFAVQVFSIFLPDNISLKLNDLVNGFFNSTAAYSAFYFLLVVIFTYFYTAVTFDPKEIAKNLQRSGGFILGIRPGQSTSEFIAKITGRITLFGALFLGLVAVLPNVTQILTGIAALTIGGAALLIVVSVALEFLKEIDSQLTIREYEGLK